MAPSRVPWTLIIWIGVACAFFLGVPPPPEPPPPTEEELAAQQRATDFVVRDTKAWQTQRGDLALPWADAEGHMAIVIDDVGRELHLLDKLLALRFRLTFSVLPGSVYAAGAQLRVGEDRRRYREVLLHLPMEPLDASQMHAGAEASETFLLASDSPSTLREKVEAALRAVPAARGVNNHMGSRLTTDRMAMDVVMQGLRERGLYFLDSRTDAATAAQAAAQQAGLLTGAREVFLDNDVTRDAIEAQLAEAVELSRDHPVVVIGHPSAELHAVLERRLPELHENAIGVYPLSEVLQQT